MGDGNKIDQLEKKTLFIAFGGAALLTAGNVLILFVLYLIAFPVFSFIALVSVPACYEQNQLMY